MLNQLSRLSLEADGRYASSQELQPLKDYIQSLDMRVSAYKKIQAAEAEIINSVEAKMQATNPNLFRKGNRDVTKVCKRDRIDVLRYSMAALLSNDLDRLQQNFLLWYQTIIRAHQDGKAAGVSYQIMQEVVKQYLTSEEAALLSPILGLNKVILGK